MYIVIERCIDDFFGPEATQFLDKKSLIKYLKESEGIIQVFRASDITDEFYSYIK